MIVSNPAFHNTHFNVQTWDVQSSITQSNSSTGSLRWIGRWVGWLGIVNWLLWLRLARCIVAGWCLIDNTSCLCWISCHRYLVYSLIAHWVSSWSCDDVSRVCCCHWISVDPHRVTDSLTNNHDGRSIRCQDNVDNNSNRTEDDEYDVRS